jgi:rhomboid protease GluP
MSEGQKRPHPLEVRPTPQSQRPRQQTTLHIPSVKPLVTYTILAANIAIFVLRAVSPELDVNLLVWGANGPREVLQLREYYRLLTSMFLHSGIYSASGHYVLANSLHLIFNAYFIYWIGLYIEPLFGHLRFGLIYLLGGLAGGIVSNLISTLLGNLNTISVGASGAAFALIGAEFVFLYYHRKLLRQQARAQMRSLIAITVINLLFGFASSLGLTETRVNNWAHLGGLAGGVLLAWFISPIFLLRRHPDVPGDLLGEDANPLRRKYRALSAYVAGLLALLIVSITIAN